MKITIDTHTLAGTATGIPRYVRNLVQGVEELDVSGLEVHKVDGGITGDLKTYERVWWEMNTLPKLVNEASSDLFHVPGFGVRKVKGKKTIITAHDIIGYLFPENLSFTARAYWGKWLPHTYKQADHLITVSEHSKRDLVEHLGIPEEKVSVTYLGVDPGCEKVAMDVAVDNIVNELNLTDPYFLFIGTIEPRKNLIRTLKAYRAARLQHNDFPKLVVVGARKWGTKEFERAIRELELEQDVITTGFVSDELLVSLYTCARAVVFVSTYEGFGLPLLEAFHFGAPVLASNNSSLGELGKDTAYLVNPYSVEQISTAMINLFRDDKLCEELSSKGLKRAEDFSWKKTAEQTVEVYKKVLS